MILFIAWSSFNRSINPSTTGIISGIRGIKQGKDEENGVLPKGAADLLTKAVIVADLPAASQPVVYVRRTEGPEFAKKLPELTVTDPNEACYLPPVEVIVERAQP